MNSNNMSKLKTVFLISAVALTGCYESTEKTVYLDQGWDAQNQYREISYNMSQGSNLIPYDWYLALEIPHLNIPLKSKIVTETLRYLSTDVASELNPDKLPVGFVKNIDIQNKAWIGLTCAACHTSQINYKNTGIRIDGGPAMGDFMNLLKLVRLSIIDTMTAEHKFETFASKLYGQDWFLQADVLKQEMASMEQKLAGIIERNSSIVESGYGRVDAFGSIGNEVFVDDLNIPANFSQANAPVDYPFLWDT
ncbi:MAG: di-heme-cytochrome C peroxidase, partial [Gammaproteobacteria bacterium]|nr:di-heme-cytochrome C peroxidase [Gammaproteobacteria bacterium]